MGKYGLKQADTRLQENAMMTFPKVNVFMETMEIYSVTFTDLVD